MFYKDLVNPYTTECSSEAGPSHSNELDLSCTELGHMEKLHFIYFDTMSWKYIPSCLWLPSGLEHQWIPVQNTCGEDKFKIRNVQTVLEEHYVLSSAWQAHQLGHFMLIENKMTYYSNLQLKVCNGWSLNE